MIQPIIVGAPMSNIAEVILKHLERSSGLKLLDILFDVSQDVHCSSHLSLRLLLHLPDLHVVGDAYLQQIHGGCIG